MNGHANGTSETVWASATTSGRLGRADAAAYLERISLPPALLDESPSLDLLRQLQSAHILAVPFESLTLHVPDWHDDDAEIHLGGGHPVGLGSDALNRIVRLKRGGFCFSANSSFAAFLRYFGFRVSECAGRVFSFQRKDPAKAGYSWEPTSHQCVSNSQTLKGTALNLSGFYQSQRGGLGRVREPVVLRRRVWFGAVCLPVRRASHAILPRALC